jgi:outer membrane protein TolC
MISRATYFCVLLTFICSVSLFAQETKTPAPRHITVGEAVQLALKHNHVVRISAFRVEEKEHDKEIARSSYFPSLRNESNFAHLTDTQFIGIPQGSLGTVGGTPIPERIAILNQGGLTFLTSGTQLTQPIGELWKIRSANDVAAADLKAARSEARQTENEIALRVHQLFYRILIVQAHRDAAQARTEASEALHNERVQQSKYGTSLQEEVIESRAQSLEAKQDLLTTDLQLSDLNLQLDDLIGLPLTTPLALDANIREVGETCKRQECIRVALEAHPEVAEARAEIEKAAAAVRLAKRQYLPDIDAFARYSYQDNVPFLARNFGTFGIHLSYEFFDGGKRNAVIGEHKAQLSQAEENLARIKEDVEMRVQTAYNKLERTRELMKVSEDLLALRTESRRVLTQQLEGGSALQSQLAAATAQELDAKANLLQSQLDYIQAEDEMTEAIGSTPN